MSTNRTPDEICIAWFKSEWAMGIKTSYADFEEYEPYVTPGLYSFILLLNQGELLC